MLGEGNLFFLPLFKKGVGGMKKLVNFMVIMIILLLPVAVRAEIIEKEGYELVKEGQFYIDCNKLNPQYSRHLIEYAKTQDKIRLIEIEISAGISPELEYRSGTSSSEVLSVNYPVPPAEAYLRYRKVSAGERYKIESSLINDDRTLNQTMVLKVLIDNRYASRSMKFKIEGIEGEFESFYHTYNLYFSGINYDGKEKVVNYKVYNLDENLDLEDENIWNHIDIIYEDYVLEVRDFKRGRQLWPYWPEHYYYMGLIYAYPKGSDYMSDAIEGYLYIVQETDDFWVGNIFSKEYVKRYRLVGMGTKYDIEKGDFGPLGGKIFTDPPMKDKIRFVFVPDRIDYRRLFFTVDFNKLDEEQRNGFIIDSEDEKYIFPDDRTLEDEDLIDYIDSIDNIVSEEEIYDVSEGDLVKKVMEYINEFFDDVKEKFVDIIDIANAVKNMASASLGSGDDWQGIRLNTNGLNLPISVGEVFIVSPVALNKVRVSLRVLLAGCMYLVTGLFAVRKIKDIFSW